MKNQLTIFILFLVCISFVYSNTSHTENHSKTEAKNNNNVFFKNHVNNHETSTKSHLNIRKTALKHKTHQVDVSRHSKNFMENEMRKLRSLRHPETRSTKTMKTRMHNLENPYHARVQSQFQQAKVNDVYQGWLTIKSDHLYNSTVFPLVPDDKGILAKLPLTSDNKLVNKMWTRDSTAIPTKFFFWARLKGKYLYFTNVKAQFNIVTYLHLNTIVDIQNLRDEFFCFSILTNTEQKYKMCAYSEQDVNKWVCLIGATVRDQDPDFECSPDKIAKNAATKILERKITQPFIIIPTAQEFCNAKWDFQNEGKEWRCICSDGLEQSPIDLPPTNLALESPRKPIFDYKITDKVHSITSNNGLAIANKPVEIELINDVLTINHANMGKLVSLEGSVYLAEEIYFHTPSEHTINGESFPLEIQIVHRAATKGDFGKRAILSFLFKGKAGVYNKFIDSMDFFTLPNPHTKKRKLYEKFYIPNILVNSDEEDAGLMSFSFYTYQGSQTQPPCAEGVIHYVASDVLDLSITAIEMFKEALREPDYEDAMGNFIKTPYKKLKNSRATQALNGRPIWHFNTAKYGLPSFRRKKNVQYIAPGHYEKVKKEAVSYVYVEGSKASGVPGAIVVPDEEAQ